MTANLTLVSDNSRPRAARLAAVARPPSAAKRSSSPPRERTGPSAPTPTERADAAWVHAAWLPAPRLRRTGLNGARTGAGARPSAVAHPAGSRSAASRRAAPRARYESGDLRGILADERGAVTAEYAVVIMAVVER